MKNNNKNYWLNVIELLSKGIKPIIKEIDFNNEKISFKNVALLNRYDFRVPEHLIEYNDDKIDFSDNPDITDQEIKTLQVLKKVNATLPIDNEINEWLKTENVNINKLLTQLLKNFYETVQNVQKNIAI